MTCSGRTRYRAALAACAAVVWVAAPLAPPSAASAAVVSTWYWQNPLPREYFVTAIACGSITACVAVGDTTVSTDDGGQHWTERPSGNKIGLQSVTCPAPAICYALGSEVIGQSPGGRPPNVKYVILKSGDGGRTWQHPSPRLPTGAAQNLNELVCPSVTTCLAGGSNYSAQGKNPLLRTTDSGRTWRAVSLPGPNNFVAVTCATVMICYATRGINGRSDLARSDDSGKTWTLHGLHSPQGLARPELGTGGMACPAANSCFATAMDCGSFECNVGHIYVTSDGARTWKRVHYGTTGGIVCPNTTTCYAASEQSVLRTTNGGKTWSVRRLPAHAGGLTCPGPATCYMTTLVAVLKTSDGFDHTRETLAHSVIHNQTLTEISCPATESCYAAGSRNVCPPDGPCDQAPASFATTGDGGRTWRATPQTPDLLERLSCPRVSVCFAIGDSDPDPIAVDRSDDGARTWHQIGWKQISTRLLPNNRASDITCVAGTTCYVLATVGETLPGSNNFVQRVAVLITHDTGRTWSVETGLDTAARTGSTGPPNLLMPVTPSRISCPSVTTCFVLATVSSNVAATTSLPAHAVEQIVILSTTDGGESWTRHLTVPGTVPGTGYAPLGQDLSCPTTTTCYLLSFTQNPQAGNPNGLPGPVLVTHDAGATWSRSVVSSGAYLMAISCATAQSCRVAASPGIFVTVDGGVTWQREPLADGSQSPSMVSIACPAVDTCYAVGGLEPCCGVIILATHPSGVRRPLIRTMESSFGDIETDPHRLLQSR